MSTARWFVEVTDARGNTMQLRHDAKPGAGPIVYFRTRLDAEIAVESFMPGLDPADTVSIQRRPSSSPSRATPRAENPK